MLGDSSICESCLEEFVELDLVRRHRSGPLRLSATVFAYRGRVGQAVRRLKYSRATALGAPLSKMVADAAARLGLLECDLVVPVPIHWSRRCSRGFNQSELLCEHLPNVRRDVLRRVRRTRPQARMGREQRIANLKGAFTASIEVRGRSVLLVDDVLTSGETSRECARALLIAGAAEVSALALAGEPL